MEWMADRVPLLRRGERANAALASDAVEPGCDDLGKRKSKRRLVARCTFFPREIDIGI
jgi:hypothetical protein